MTTNVEIITDALREINVIHELETPSAEQGKYSMRRLNLMIEAWTEDGIDLGYFPQTDTTATIQIPAWAEAGVIAKLAIRLAPHYGATVSQELIDDAETGYSMILRKSLVEKNRPADMSHMPLGMGGRGRNILTDR